MSSVISRRKSHLLIAVVVHALLITQVSDGAAVPTSTSTTTTHSSSSSSEMSPWYGHAGSSSLGPPGGVMPYDLKMLVLGFYSSVSQMITAVESEIAALMSSSSADGLTLAPEHDDPHDDPHSEQQQHDDEHHGTFQHFGAHVARGGSRLHGYCTYGEDLCGGGMEKELQMIYSKAPIVVNIPNTSTVVEYRGRAYVIKPGAYCCGSEAIVPKFARAASFGHAGNFVRETAVSLLEHVDLPQVALGSEVEPLMCCCLMCPANAFYFSRARPLAAALVANEATSVTAHEERHHDDQSDSEHEESHWFGRFGLHHVMEEGVV
ncbi:hypothetical protein PPROV_000082200 [Pycnococcus provasolii]|uniref:Uncharacterized protein n=1 Tax=Pycnococcus provasolii TaxID=41880 RepID=A0A830H4K2_9CHLO|nr:hypothetical protein PPROV_000082200 [Pycnococcus provasolii]